MILECDVCGKPIRGKFYLDEAFLKQKTGEAERYHVRVIPVAVCVSCELEEGCHGKGSR